MTTPTDRQCSSKTGKTQAGLNKEDVGNFLQIHWAGTPETASFCNCGPLPACRRRELDFRNSSVGSMTRQVRSRRAGRPSKGDRHVMTARVPVETADLIFRLADSRGIPASEFIAEAVQEKLARTDLSDVEIQEELPLQETA